VNEPIDTLTVVSHVTHYRWRDRFWAYGPYSREIDIWADLFRQVTIAAPLVDAQPPDDNLMFARPNITVSPQVRAGGTTPAAHLRKLFLAPLLFWSVSRAMRGAGVVHVRCPGNLGLVGALVGPLWSKRLIVKYAGQWNGYPGEAASVRFQRWLLRSRWWRKGIVTVYGEWPGMPPQIVPFFTSMMTAGQVAAAREIAQQKRPGAPLELLYAGRLSVSKRVDVLLEALATLAGQGMDARLTVVGDGAESGRLRELTGRLGLDSRVTFAGAVPFEKMIGFYDRAHCLVLPSDSEGWPKVIAEAMCHGLVCFGSDSGLVPWLLRDRGIVSPPRDPATLAREIAALAADPERYRVLSARAAEWSAAYSIEGLRSALRELMESRWKIELRSA
jgi:glycosyltransferase involved in cell wall biosynthesis